MIRVAVHADIADQFHRPDGQIELIDDQSNRVGVVRRPPTKEEFTYAESRIGTAGPKYTVEQLIVKVVAV